MNRRKIVTHTLTIMAFVLLGNLVFVQGQGPSPKTQEANKLWQDQKWIEAAKAYEGLTRTEPNNGQAWFRLGSSLASLNKFSEAIRPLERATEILGRPVVYYTLGSIYAKLNNKEKAFDNLTKAAGAGFPNINQVKNDPNLAEIRSDSRFKAVYEAIEKNARPCKYSAEAKQFDFWIGEWDVTVNGQIVGTNVIQQLEEGCLIMENWSGNGGSTGKSMNFYNPFTKKWRQTYMSNGQVVWEMAGEYKDGAMRYDGEINSPAGRVLTRVILYNQSPDKIRHTQDDSRDNGKTWTNVWDSVYVRRKTTATTN